MPPAVARAAGHFDATNHGVLRDPRMNLVLGDARNAVRFGRGSCDFIIYFVPWPAHALGHHLASC